MTLKVLIVDEQRSERTSLVELCEEHGDVDIVGEAESGASALRAAGDLCPDVMLVDVQLPDMSGFDLLCAARGQREPMSFIVTGRLDHAAAALAAGALDYLIKPVEVARLGQSLERAQHHRRSLRTSTRSDLPPQPPVDLHFPLRSHSPLEFLVGERQRRFYPLEMGKIDYIESQGNYVMIHSGTNAYIRRDSIKRLAGHLAIWGFVRIERSILLNVRAVAYAQVADHGTFSFNLYSGACFQSSRSYRDAILGVLPLEPLSQRQERSRVADSHRK